MDDTIKTEEDVEKYLNIPVIGIIPNVTEDIK
jgi:capsular polysaccharide biosynthesis protein